MTDDEEEAGIAASRLDSRNDGGGTWLVADERPDIDHGDRRGLGEQRVEGGDIGVDLGVTRDATSICWAGGGAQSPFGEQRPPHFLVVDL